MNHKHEWKRMMKINKPTAEQIAKVSREAHLDGLHNRGFNINLYRGKLAKVYNSNYCLGMQQALLMMQGK